MNFSEKKKVRFANGSIYSLYEYKKEIGNLIYYFGSECISLEEYKKVYEKLPGYIETIITRNNLDIMVLKSNIKGIGLGTFLLLEACMNSNVDTISLDDMTENCRTDDNIYIKCGFKYKYKYGPEMIGNTKIVAKLWESIRKKYNYGIITISSKGVSTFIGSLPVDIHK
jgi:hypothetical protein